MKWMGNVSLLRSIFVVTGISLSGGFQLPNCSDPFYYDGPDSDSLVELQSCNQTKLEVWYDFSQDTFKPKLIVELVCTDGLQREISLSTESATVSLTGIAVFDINPPLAESGLGSECNVNICYLDSYFFGIYSIPSGPMTLSFQDDCRPPAADPLPTSTAHIGDYIHNSAELVSAQDDGVPVTTSSTEKYLVLTSPMLYHEPSAAISPSAHLRGTTSARSLSSLLSTSMFSHSSIRSTLSTSSSISVYHTTTSILLSSTGNHLSTTTGTNSIHHDNTGPMMSTDSITPSFVLSPTLIFTVTLLVFVTVVVVIIAILLCLVQLISQYYKRARQDIQDIQPVEIENKQIYTYSHQVSHSPSICTIVSPLSPVNVEDAKEYNFFSFDSLPITREQDIVRCSQSIPGNGNGTTTRNISDTMIDTQSSETSCSTINFTTIQTTSEELCNTANDSQLITGGRTDDSANYSYTSISFDESGGVRYSAAVTAPDEGHDGKTAEEDSYIQTVLKDRNSGK